jgi:hypothetical protein
MSIADTPLKLTRSDNFNDDEKEIVKLVQPFDNGVTLKSKVLRCYGDDVESLLQTVIEFREVAEELSFDNNEEIFKQFHKCLKSKAGEEWDPIKDRFLHLDYGIIQAQQDWFRRYVSEEMCDIQKHYLERSHLIWRCISLNVLLKELMKWNL